MVNASSNYPLEGFAVSPSLFPQYLNWNRAPTANDIKPAGTRIQDNSVSPAQVYFTTGAGTWYASSESGLSSILGTTNQITVSTSAGVATLSIPSTFIAPGSIASTTTITAGTGLTVTSGGLTVTAGGLAITGTTTINTSGSGVTTIGTGGTGAVNIGNATGNTAVTGSLTASAGLVATTGGLTVSAGGAAITGTTNINTSGSAVTTIGTGGTGAVNIGNATGNTAVTGSLTASTSLTATLGNITATNGNFVSSTAGNGFQFTSTTVSGTTTATLNGRVGQVTITTPSIAAGATFSITISNTSIAGSSTQCGYWLTGGTTGAALTIQSYSNTANQSVVTIQNGTGATTNTASLILNFLVLN